MDNFHEIYDGGGERSASIRVTLLFFKSPQDKEPYKQVTAEAVGPHDYGHSEPCKDAIKRLGRAFRNKL